MIYKIQFYLPVSAEKISNRSFINFIVAYLDNCEIYIINIGEQHVLGFIYIDTNFI